MKREEFYNYLTNKVMVLDGATGTELQKRGMPSGVSPEQWVMDNPDKLIEIQREYVSSGSNAVYAYSFGSNRIKLGEYGLSHKVFEINKRLAQISREAVGDKALVAGDLSPTGQFIKPYGDLEFEEVVEIYKEQVKGLLEGGVDFFVIETMMDIQEARAALIAVKESCDLPVCVSMTFSEDGRTMMGTDAATALITLQSLGADAVGCNCSTGPQSMQKVLRAMKDKAMIPLLAKPNAGLPKLIDGKTVFDMGPEEFGTYINGFVNIGINLMGGCCGTSPAYIKQIRDYVARLIPSDISKSSFVAATTARGTVPVNIEAPAIIGNRINIQAGSQIRTELEKDKTDLICDLAMEQMDEGVNILNVKVPVSGTEEIKIMLAAIGAIVSMAQLPVCLETSDPDVLEAALRIYPGRALVNLTSIEDAEMSSIVTVASKYGALIVVKGEKESMIRQLIEEYRINSKMGKPEVVVLGQEVRLLD